MRASLPFAPLLFASLLAAGCRGREPRSPALPTAALPAPPLARPPSARGICDVDPSSCPRGQTVRTVDVSARVYASEESVASSSTGSLVGGLFGSAPSAPTPQLPPGSNPTNGDPQEMIEVEARLAIQCESVTKAATSFRQLARASGATITLDEASAGTTSTEVTFEVRVPMASYERFVDAFGALGIVRAREVKARDVAKEYHDAQLLLRNQEAAMKRYEDLLATAHAVAEVLEIERQLERLRAEIDRIKGDIAWMKDRVARATIRVRFYPSTMANDAVFAPEATLYPGLRAEALVDLRDETQRAGYAGGGLSLQFKRALGITFGRAFTIDFDLARSAFGDRPSRSKYAYLALLGSDFYSDLLGGGRRTFLNPYLGWRAGYAQTEGHGDLAIGGVLGLDLVKTSALLIDLHVRVLALAGSELGPHLAVGPGLGANVAF
jgi:hypothetical protein